MVFYPILFAVSVGISISAMPLLKRLAFKYNIMIDMPNERNIHAKAIPRNGGIGIALASFIAIFLGFAMRPGISSEEFLHLIGILSRLDHLPIQSLHNQKMLSQLMGHLQKQSVSHFLQA